MHEALFQFAPPSAMMLETPLPADRVSGLPVGLIVDQPPATVFHHGLVFRHPSPEVGGLADVNTPATWTLYYIEIMHKSFELERGTPSSEVTGLDCRVP